MLRVLSLGLKLPQSTATALFFRVLTWYLPSQSLKIGRARLSSDFSMRFPAPPKLENDSNEELEKPSDEDQHKIEATSAASSLDYRGILFQKEIQRNPIRPLRPRRPPPKYSSGPMLLGTGSSNAGIQRVSRHPLHRELKAREDNAEMIPSLEDLLPEDTPPSSNRPRLPRKRNNDELLHVLAVTHSINEAWEAYDVLLARSPRRVTRNAKQRASLVIPYNHLHRFARLLSTTHPRTRSLFQRLLSVLTTLRDTGGTIYTWEWNALIDCAGKGWRKTTMDDYRSALSIFKDMVTTGKNSSSEGVGNAHEEDEDKRPVAEPDIVTFTSLLHIASRSFSKTAIGHATSLLDASELPWNRITHISKLGYFIRFRQFDAVLGILQAAVNRGLDLDTLNGCMWAYARNGQLRVALEVYERLKDNIPVEDRTIDPSSHPSSEGNGATDNPILNISRFSLPVTMRPDKITYTLLIQALCFHGDFIGAMTIFRDMVSTVDPATRYDPHPTGRPRQVPSCFRPSLAVYRSIFLGFARHADQKPTFASTVISKRRNIAAVSLPEFAARLTPSYPGAEAYSLPEQLGPHKYWTLDQLETLFKSFLEMGWDTSDLNGPETLTIIGKPSERMIYWIMVAYAKATKRDVGKMHKVWQELDARYGYGNDGVGIWTGRLKRFGERLENRYRASNVAGDVGPDDSSV